MSAVPSLPKESRNFYIKYSTNLIFHLAVPVQYNSLMLSSTSHLKIVSEKFATEHLLDNPTIKKCVTGILSASQQRVLVTKWLGQAWEETAQKKEMIAPQGHSQLNNFMMSLGSRYDQPSLFSQPNGVGTFWSHFSQVSTSSSHLFLISWHLLLALLPCQSALISWHLLLTPLFEALPLGI